MGWTRVGTGMSWNWSVSSVGVSSGGYFCLERWYSGSMSFYVIRSFQEGVRRMLLLFLLLLSCLALFVTMHGSVRDGVGLQAQSPDTVQPWLVKSFLWNQQGNVWVRTNCTMTIGGTGSESEGLSAQSACSNTSSWDKKLSFVEYYHDVDPDDITPDDTTDDVYGKIKGRAWSPLYGLIYFDPSDFPFSGSNSSCYGLTGYARQPRIQRVSGKVRLTGCAYVPLLRDYILFNKSGATASGVPSHGWDGVTVDIVEDAASAYLALYGCAWSSDGGYWSIGPNQSSASQQENCLPSDHNTELKKELPESRIGAPGGVRTSVNPTRSSAKIGQEIGYQYACPDGYATPSLRIGSRIVAAALSLFRGSYREIFTDPVDTLLLTCTDRTGIFTALRNSSGAISAGVKDTFFINSFTVTPPVLTEGGFVSFGGKVSNQGGFSSRAVLDVTIGHCDNTVRDGCVYGDANDAAVTDNVLYYKWRCDGSSGVHSGTCQFPKGGGWNDTGTIEKKLNASDKAVNDYFGSSVSLSGDTLVVGAEQEDPVGAADGGTVYIYTDHNKDGDWTDTGTIERKLNASDKASYDYFGSSVSLSGDTLVVGARSEDPAGATDGGTVYIYTDHNKDGDWTDTGTIEKKLNASDKASNDNFGSSVSLSGNTLVVGARSEDPAGATDGGTVYIYTDHNKDDDWTDTGTIEKKLNASDKTAFDYFGYSVSLSGDILVVGAKFEDPTGTAQGGTVYIYTDHNKDGDWTDTGTIEKKLNASDKAINDYFGSSVSLSGDTLVVGAEREDPDPIGAPNGGTVYIYTDHNKDGDWTDTGTIEKKLNASDKAKNDLFGSSVSLSGDTLVVGAEQENPAGAADGGTVYIYTDHNKDGDWTDSGFVEAKIQSTDKAAGDYFGWSVALDGTTAIVGAYAEGHDVAGANNKSEAGSAYLLTKSGNSWTQQKLVASDRQSSDRFGRSVAIDGNTAIVGAYLQDYDASNANSKSSAGAAYIFTKSGSTWSQQQKLVADDRDASDHFGYSVAISGNTAIVGAYNAGTSQHSHYNRGAVYLFTRSGSTWSQQAKLEASDKRGDDHFGWSVALDGTTALVGAPNQDFDSSDRNYRADAGAVYVFTLFNSTWTQQAKLVARDRAPGRGFGYSVALEGDTALIGGLNRDHSINGSAYLFTRTGYTWSQEAKLVPNNYASHDAYGASVSFSGTTALVGAYLEDTGGFNAGSAYLFTKIGSSWQQLAQVQPTDVASSDHFGRSVSLDGNTALIGANGEDTDAGAAYTFGVPVSGVCDNTKRDGCASGTANDTVVVDTPTHYRWQCDGSDGGSDSGACQFSRTGVPGNEGYCTITNRISKEEVSRFNVDGVNVPIVGSDLAVQDAVYDLVCKYKKFAADGSLDKWQSVSSAPIAVKVLPQDVSEQNIVVTLASPVFSESGSTVSVSLPTGAAMVLVYRLHPSSASQVGSGSLYKIFIDKDAVALDVDETIDEVKERLFERAAQGKVSFITSGSGGITQSAVAGNTLVAIARTVDGVWSKRAVYTPTAAGVCGATRNSCVIGTANDSAVADTDVYYQWRCDGVSGGVGSVICKVGKKANGVCNNAVRNGCVSGVANDAVVIDTSNYYRWRCDGTGGGSNSGICRVLKSVVTIASCDETVQNGCVNGVANDDAIADDDTHYKWRCDGVRGDIGPSCQILKTAVIAGVCNNAVAAGCTTGTLNTSAVQHTPGYYQWQCDGSGGGANSETCFFARAAPAQQAKIQATDKAASDYFGWSVALDGNTAIVGAYAEDHDVAGANSKSSAGSAYIFTKSGSTWSQQQKLVASDRRSGDYFGWSVAIDGNTAIVGAYLQGYDASNANSKSSAGAAYIFTKSGSTWSQQQKLVADDRDASDHFGYSVAISGNTAIVGAYNAGTSQHSHYNRGAVYLFTRSGSTWSQQAKLEASDKRGGDRFGWSVALDGTTALVGAPNQNFDSSDRNYRAEAGAVYVFTLFNSTWTQQAKLVARDRAPNRGFGYSVALEGDTALIGGLNRDHSNNGSAYLFTRTGYTWSQEAKLIPNNYASHDAYGASVSFSGTTALVGAYLEDTGSSNAGSAYLFTKIGSSWQQLAQVQPTDVASSDHFGRSVSLDGNTALVGAYFEDTGGFDGGAAYTFTFPIAGVCDTARNTCISGTANATAVADTSTYYKWQCDGIGGAPSSSACEISKSLIAGACGTTKVYACTTGTLNTSAVQHTPGYYQWQCDGSGGGANSETCFFARAAPAQQAKIQATDKAANDYFGWSVALDGNTAIVGAYAEDHDVAGANDKSGAGSAYIFTKSGSTWSQQQKLVASDRRSSDYFGWSVAIDGNTAIVGAYLQGYDASNANSKSSAGAAYIFTKSGSTWSQQQKLVADDRDASDHFGYSVAISGNTAIVGAYNAGTSQHSHYNRGAVYLFTRSGSTWSQQAKLEASDKRGGDRFGWSVALDGTTALVGAPNQNFDSSDRNYRAEAGAVYVFTLFNSTWTQQAKLVARDRAPNRGFGYSVALEGDTALIGGLNRDHSNNGSAYLFTRTGYTWSQEAKLIPNNYASHDAYGASVSFSGTTALVGAYLEDTGSSNAGSAYLFTKIGSSWQQLAQVQPTDVASSDHFGRSVSLDGNTALVGAYFEDTGGFDGGAAYTFTFPIAGVCDTARNTCISGTANATAVADTSTYYKWQCDGIGGAPSSSACEISKSLIAGACGTTKVYACTTGTLNTSAVQHTPGYYQWQCDGSGGGANSETCFFARAAPAQQAKIQATDKAASDYFGWSVALDGNTAIVGAYAEDHDVAGANSKSSAGSAYIFTKSGSTWSQQQKLVASDRRSGDYFGWSVAIDGNTAIVGAYLQGYDASNANSKSSAGAAYIFTKSGSTWSQQQKLVADDRDASDHFGYSVAISGNTAIVGAYNAGTSQHSHYNRGAVYLFTRSGSTWSQQAKLEASDKRGDDRFGWSVALDGTTALVGAPNQGFDSSDRNYRAEAGAVYVFTLFNSTWTQQAKLVARDRAPNRGFGYSVALEGDTALIGGLNRDHSNNGSAYLFTRTGYTWSQEAKLIPNNYASHDAYGASVSFSGTTALVGAYLEDTGSSNAGSAYLFTKIGSSWQQLAQVQPTDVASSDYFGRSVSLDGNTALVGAYFEDTGGFDGGAAYTFTFPIAGVCDTARNTCISGTANATAVADTSTYYKWQCDGIGGAPSSGVCQARTSQPFTPPTIAGVCATVVAGTTPTRSTGCTAGTFNDAVVADTIAYYRWRCDGIGGGANSATCQTPKPANGSCATLTGSTTPTNLNACLAGSYNAGAVDDTDTHYNWRCDGVGGGVNSATCSSLKPPAAGVCNNVVRNSCTVGTLSDVTDTTNYYQWRCDGLNGGASSVTCKILKSLYVVGSCDNTARNGCTAGTADDSIVADDGTYYKWRCDGSGGGADSNDCQIAKSSVIAGSCATLTIGAVPTSANGCSAGTYTDLADSTNYYQWRCNGVAGGDQSGVCQALKRFNFTTLVAAGNGAPRGIWSNGTTMWVVDSSDDKLYAYNMATKARDSSKDFNTLSAAGNNNPYGLWSNGTTMWVIDISDKKIYAYAMSTKARDSSKDFTALQSAGNTSPRGIWSNGTTMWVADWNKKIYAYSMSSKARDTSKEFTSLDAQNTKPRGIWSNGTTMWVVDFGKNKLYAYNLSTRTRTSSKDVSIPQGNAPHGVWSNNIKVWVGTAPIQLHAFDLSVAGVCNNAVRNGCVAGTANDGIVTDDGTYYKWRCDGVNGGANSGDCQIAKSSYIIGSCNNAVRNGCAAGTANDGIVADDNTYYKWRCDGSGGGADSSDCQIAKSSYVVGSCNNVVRNGCTAGTANDGIVADDNTYYKWRCDGSGGGANSSDCQILKSSYIIGSCNNTIRNGCAAGTANDGAVNDDGTYYKWRCDGSGGGGNSGDCQILRSLYVIGSCNNAVRNGCTAGTVRDVADITDYYQWQCDGSGGGANSPTCQILKSAYVVGDCATLTKGTIPSSSNACSAGSYNDSAVADTDTHHNWQCDGAGGGGDDSTCSVEKEFAFTTLVAAGNGAPRGIWSNGTTMWVVDSSDDKLYAYNMATKARDSSKDFNTLSAAGNNNPYGLWSNGTTMWVVDISDKRIYAYAMSTKARDSSKDFTALQSAGNTSPRGIWSNGTTMWVADWNKKIYAYSMSSKARDTSKEFTSLDAQNTKPRGIWSNGTTMWVVDFGKNKLYAYNLSTKARISSKDVTVSNSPHGVWSNSTKVWVSGSPAKLYAFDL